MEGVLAPACNRWTERVQNGNNGVMAVGCSGQVRAVSKRSVCQRRCRTVSCVWLPRRIESPAAFPPSLALTGCII